MPELTSANTTDTIQLTWNQNSAPGIVGYRLHYGTASGYYTMVSNLGSALSATVSALKVGQKYFFVVTDYNIGGYESAPSNEVVYEIPVH